MCLCVCMCMCVNSHGEGSLFRHGPERALVFHDNITSASMDSLLEETEHSMPIPHPLRPPEVIHALMGGIDWDLVLSVICQTGQDTIWKEDARAGACWEKKKLGPLSRTWDAIYIKQLLPLWRPSLLYGCPVQCGSVYTYWVLEMWLVWLKKWISNAFHISSFKFKCKNLILDEVIRKPLSLCGTTCICESTFSMGYFMKSTYGSSFSDANLAYEY